MVAEQHWEVKIRERKKRKSTDKNGAAKQGQTADEEKKQKGVISWPRQASYLNRWSD